MMETTAHDHPRRRAEAAATSTSLPDVAAPARAASRAIIAKPVDPRQTGLFDAPLPGWIKPCLPTCAWNLVRCCEASSIPLLSKGQDSGSMLCAPLKIVPWVLTTIVRVNRNCRASTSAWSPMCQDA